jgi:hypothetical protein
MVHAISANFPFAGTEGIVLYHPLAVEKYVPVAPGIEVSIGPYTDIRSGERGSDSPVYNRRGKLIRAKRKGDLVDTYL